MKASRFIIHLLFFALVATNMQGQEKPKAYIVSDAHFDSQWNWDVQTSISEYILKTLDQNLFLLGKYPDYVFNFEGGIKYAWMKEYFPEKYEEVKKYIAQGRWHVTGSTWDATDVNIPSPESFTRNILYGQLFYQDEFKVRSTDIFLPDCFGFGWTLPTIAAHSGLIGFSTQKLMWRTKPFHGESKIPFEIGLWQGVDGARIMLVADAHNYTTRWPDEDLSKNPNLIRFINASPLKTVYHYYGTGDTGGAPSIESVRALEKGLKGDGPVKIISATSDQLYKDYLPFANHPELPVFNGELLMDVHGTGCYTSQAAMKLYNRSNELLADAAERASVMADWLGGQVYPRETLAEAWKRFIWHQFHDDLTGTSIPRAYEFSWNDELISQKEFAQVLTASSGAVARALDTQVKGTPLLIQNPVAQSVKGTVEVTVDAKAGQALAVYNEQGKEVPSQVLGYNNGKARLLLQANVPAVSYVVYDVRAAKASAATQLKVTDRTIENSIYLVTLNANGDISSILDKRENRELVKKGENIRLAIFEENPSASWPAWEIIKTTTDKAPVSITQNVKISIAEKGPLRAALCIEKTYGESTFKQYIRLTNGAQDDRIDFANEIDWQSSNKLLKAEFPLNITNELATYDLGVGNVKRTNNTLTAYEVIAQYWADLTEKDNSYGVSILNNSKYGWDKPNDNTLRLTLLHTPQTSRGYAYQDKQDMGFHTFTYSLLGHKDTYVEAQTVLKAEALNQPVKAFTTSKHKGALGKSFSFMQSSDDRMVVKALKKGEKTDNYVVRLYETTGKDVKNFTLTFAGEIAEASELNGVEDVIGKARIEGNKLIIDATPFAMKTFSVKLKAAPVKLSAPVSQPLDLAYTVKTATYNAYRTDANIDGKGNSFAAELLPETLTTGGIQFALGDPAAPNAIKSKGDTLILPANNTYNTLYILAASIAGDQSATVYVDNTPVEIFVPNYTGFIGQWGHTGHTEGFLKPAEIAYVGTHKHTRMGNKDVPYEFTYMFKYAIQLPKNAKQVYLPDNSKVLVFAASLGNNDNDLTKAASELLTTALTPEQQALSAVVKKNLLKGAKVLATSIQEQPAPPAGAPAGGRGFGGMVKPEFAIDGDLDTRWADMGTTETKFIEIDLEKAQTVKGWIVYHGGAGGFGRQSMTTRNYNLEVKSQPGDSWKTVDTVTDNAASETDRVLSQPVTARYIRLSFPKDEQNERNFVQIADFELY